MNIVSPRHRPRIRAAFALAAVLLLAGCRQPPPEGAIDHGEVKHALEVLAAAPSQGFAPDAFGAQRLIELSRSNNPADIAARDRGLHAALVAYARAEHGLSIAAAQMPHDWGLRPEPYDAEGELRRAIAERRFTAWLDAQPPASPAYRALAQAYAGYFKIYAQGGWPLVPPGPVLAQRAQGPRVDLLRRRLAFEDPKLGEAQPSAAFDPAIAAAVAAFQTAHGLPATGAVDAATLEELNVPAQTRAAQVRANLERLRWLPRAEPATRVDVNTAAGLFDYYRDGRLVMHMRAAAGRPGDESPMLASAIDAVAFNPPWNVPDTIAQAELYPKEAANPGYFASHGFVVQSGEGGQRLVQQPSADSALGLVKFEFKNPYSVYLHDTPSKAAFNQTDRAVSHGCVRLEHAVAFARQLFADDAGWAPDRVDQIIASGQTTSTPLKHRVPVRLLYLTAFAEGDRVAFRPDIYGWDTELLQLLDRSAGRVRS